jgi:hypothetical protein
VVGGGLQATVAEPAASELRIPVAVAARALVVAGGRGAAAVATEPGVQQREGESLISTRPACVGSALHSNARDTCLTLKMQPGGASEASSSVTVSTY